MRWGRSGARGRQRPSGAARPFLCTTAHLLGPFFRFVEISDGANRVGMRAKLGERFGRWDPSVAVRNLCCAAVGMLHGSGILMAWRRRHSPTGEGGASALAGTDQATTLV
jgi:hypothetical protein